MVASQKANEAASAASQQASTLPAAARGGLARQNGEGDGSHLSSGLLQVGLPSRSSLVPLCCLRCLRRSGAFT